MHQAFSSLGACSTSLSQYQYASPSPTMSPNDRQRQQEFANRILTVGEGRDNLNGVVQWLLDGVIADNTSRSLAKKSIQHLPTRGPLCHPVNIWRNMQFSQRETT